MKEITDVSLSGFSSSRFNSQLIYYWCDTDSRGLKLEEEILCLRSDNLLDFPASQVIATIRKMLLKKGIDPKTVGILGKVAGY